MAGRRCGDVSGFRQSNSSEWFDQLHRARSLDSTHPRAEHFDHWGLWSWKDFTLPVIRWIVEFNIRLVLDDWNWRLIFGFRKSESSLAHPHPESAFPASKVVLPFRWHDTSSTIGVPSQSRAGREGCRQTNRDLGVGQNGALTGKMWRTWYAGFVGLVGLIFK